MVYSAVGSGRVQTVTEALTYTGKAKVNYHAPVVTPGVAPVSGSLDITDASVMTYQVEFDDGAGGTTYEREVYNNSATLADADYNGRKCKLDNVYLYYFPAYKKIYGDSPEDEINIDAHLSALYDNGGDAKGEGRKPLNVIIARQLSTSVSDVELRNSETNYDFTVSGTASGGGEMVLLHNFGEKLKETSTTPSGLSSHLSGTGFSDTKLIRDGILEETNLIYDVEIKIYESETDGTFETGNLLAEFTGTMND